MSESGKPSPASKTPKETAQEKQQKPKGDTSTSRSTGPNQALTAHRQSTLRNATASNDKQRKIVFKTILDSPYIVRWPTVTSEDTEDLLNLLCRTISPISEYRSALRHAKKEARVQDKLQKCTSASIQDVPPVPDKRLVEGVVFGMNVVTKQLEGMIPSSAPVLTRKVKNTSNRSEVVRNRNPGKRNIQSDGIVSSTPKKRQKIVEQTVADPVNNESEAISKSCLRVLFLFKNDIQPPHLYMHLPALVTRAGDVRIVPLAKGSQARIASALGLPRVTVIGIGGHTPELEYLCSIVESKIPPFDMPWVKQPGLIGSPMGTRRDEEESKKPFAQESQSNEGTPSSITTNTHQIYAATNIKTLKTSAPVKRDAKKMAKDKKELPKISKAT